MCSRPLFRGWFALSILLLASCTTVHSPIPETAPKPEAIFDTQPKSNDANECPSDAGSKNYPGCFYNGLGVTVDAMMKRRDEYANLARDSIHDTARFNALLPAAGALVAYRRLRELPHSGLLFPAAVAAGWFGLLNSRIPEAHKHYLRAARELQCATLRHWMWLYRTDEITDGLEPVTMSYSTRSVLEKEGISSSSVWELRLPRLAKGAQPVRAVTPSLQRLVDDLDEAIKGYGRERVRMLGVLQAPGAPAGPADAFQRAKAKGGGTHQEDNRQRIKTVTLDRLNLAIALRDDLQRLLVQLDGANFRLKQEWGDIELDVQAGLSDRLPPLQDPQVVGAALKQQLGAIAQAGEATQTERMDPALDVDLMSGVRSSLPLRTFNDMDGQKLFQAWQAAQRFKTAHDKRTEAALHNVEALRCLDRAPQVPAPVKPPPPPASAANATALPPKSP